MLLILAFVTIQQTQHPLTFPVYMPIQEIKVHHHLHNTISSQNNLNQAISLLEQEQLFQRRYEEKYDLPDPAYQQWLMINHPTAGQVQDDQST